MKKKKLAFVIESRCGVVGFVLKVFCFMVKMKKHCRLILTMKMLKIRIGEDYELR